MKKFWLGNINKKFDCFALGNSAVVYFIVIFFLFPVLAYFHLPSKIIEYISNQNISILTWETTFYLIVGITFFILGYQLLNLFLSSQDFHLKCLS